MTPCPHCGRRIARRLALLAALAGALTAAVLVLSDGSSHAVPLHKPWSKLTLVQRENYLKRQIRHAETAIVWIKQHRSRYRRSLASAYSLIRVHRRLERRATRNLHETQDEFVRTGSWSTRHRIVAEIICSFRWVSSYGSSCSGPVQVVRCETGDTWSTSLIDPGSQYVGLPQMGDSERAQYGVGRFHTADRGRARGAGAWEEIQSMHNMFDAGASGRNVGSWQRWACRPDGSVAY